MYYEPLYPDYPHLEQVAIPDDAVRLRPPLVKMRERKLELSKEILDWCAAHVGAYTYAYEDAEVFYRSQGTGELRPLRRGYRVVLMRFENPSDMLAFKLRWST